MAAEPAHERNARRLSWPLFALIVIVYLAIIQGIGKLIGVDTSGSRSQFPTAESIIRNALIPIGLSIVFTAGVTTWLGWWPQVLRCHVPVRRWVWFVPISMIVASVAGFNYVHATDQPAGLVVCLLLLGVFVGVGEELMFRGIGVNVFRRAGLSEGKVALYSSIVFGLVHVSNAIGHGPQALLQAAVVSTSGYFFYLCLGVSGTILAPMAVHGLWDTSLVSNLIGASPSAGLGIVLSILLQIVLIVVLIARRHKITGGTPGSATAAEVG